MKNFYYLFLVLFSFQVSFAQNNLLTKEEIDSMYDQMDVTQPETEAKIETLIQSSKKINYKEGIMTGKMSLLNVLNRRSDYKKMIEIIDELEASGIKNNEQISTINIYKYYINKAIGIEKVQYQNLQDAIKFAKLIKNQDKKHLRTATAYNLLAMYYDYKQPDSLLYYLEKQLEELEKISDNDPKLKAEKYNSIALNNINIGNFYLGVANPQRLDLAEPYYLKVYNYRTTNPDVFKSNDMPILCGVGRFYMVKGEYEKSIEIGNEILQIEKRKKNPTYRHFAYMLLEDSYEGLNNPVEQIKYTTLFMELSDSLNKAAKKEVSQQFDKLVTDVEAKKEKEYNFNLRIILTGIGCFILILSFIVWFYWQRNNKIIQQKYEVIISKIKSEAEIQKSNDEINDQSETEILENPKEISETNEPKSSIGITDETLHILISKLEKFEKSKLYLKKEISRPWLTSHLNTNSKYLFDLIKNHRGKNFIDYINGLRIDYIMRKLVEDPVYREYKNEYLAEECGFNSRQVFINAFKKETGFTPSYFIENLKKEVDMAIQN